MVRRSSSGIDHTENEEFSIKIGLGRGKTSNGRNPSDRKAGFGSRKGGVCATKWFTRGDSCLFDVDAISPSRDKQNGTAAFTRFMLLLIAFFQLSHNCGLAIGFWLLSETSKFAWGIFADTYLQTALTAERARAFL